MIYGLQAHPEHEKSDMPATLADAITVLALPVVIKGVRISPEVADFVRNKMQAEPWTRRDVPFMFRKAGMSTANTVLVEREFFLREKRLGRVVYQGKGLWKGAASA